MSLPAWRLRGGGVLAVVGPSGCGKSSLVRAGVAAALQRDGHTGRGAHPRAATHGRHRRGAKAPQRRRPRRRPAGGAVALLTEPRREVEFLDGLLEQAACARWSCALRVDQVGGLAAHPAFARLVERGLYLLGEMGADDLRAAIEGPARQAASQLEPGLVDLLVREVEGSLERCR